LGGLYLFREWSEADFPKPRYYWVSGNSTSFPKQQILTLAKVLVLLMDLLKDSELAPLRRDIVTWLLRVLLPKNVPNIPIPEVAELQEMNTMLYETIQNWYKDAEVRGKVEGKAKLVIELLETKFGVQPASMRATIAKFDSETLSKCSQRLFTAKTVQEVIEPSLSQGAST